SLARGEIAPPEGRARLAGVAPELAGEAAALEELVAPFAERCRAALARHGERVREAQFTLHRLADMLAALFVAAALLSRASASAARGALDAPELDLARLACRRASRDFRRAMDEEAHPNDELVERVARGVHA